MRRPLIGLTSYAENVQYNGNDVMAGMLPMSYVQAVHATGGRAVLITPTTRVPTSSSRSTASSSPAVGTWTRRTGVPNRTRRPTPTRPATAPS